jgi:hypothetical protein
MWNPSVPQSTCPTYECTPKPMETPRKEKDSYFTTTGKKIVEN